MHTEALITAIERAFDGVPRTDTSLRQFQLTDLHGMDDDFPEREWSVAGRQRTDAAWQDIADAELEAGQVVLAHMPADDFRYFLPAYLRHVLSHLHVPFWQCDVAGMTLAALTPPARAGSSRNDKLARFAALDEGQRMAIAQVLVFLAESDTQANVAPEASQALDSYWRQAAPAADTRGLRQA